MSAYNYLSYSKRSLPINLTVVSHTHIYLRTFDLLTFAPPPPTLGLSVIYSIFLITILFQKYEDVKTILYFFYPDLELQRLDDKVTTGATAVVVERSVHLCVATMCVMMCTVRCILCLCHY